MIIWQLKKTPCEGVIEFGMADPVALPDLSHEEFYKWYQENSEVLALRANIVSFMQFLGWEETHEHSWSHLYEDDPGVEFSRDSIMYYHTDGRYKGEEFLIMVVGTEGRGTRFKRRPRQSLPPYVSKPWHIYLVDISIMHAASPGKRLLLRWYMKPFKQEHLDILGLIRPEPEATHSVYEPRRYKIGRQKKQASQNQP